MFDDSVARADWGWQPKIPLESLVEIMITNLRSVNLALVFTRGVESSTISSINFSFLGSNKRFFDKLYDGPWSESSIYIAKIT